MATFRLSPLLIHLHLQGRILWEDLQFSNTQCHFHFIHFFFLGQFWDFSVELPQITVDPRAKTVYCWLLLAIFPIKRCHLNTFSYFLDLYISFTSPRPLVWNRNEKGQGANQRIIEEFHGTAGCLKVDFIFGTEIGEGHLKNCCSTCEDFLKKLFTVGFYRCSAQ